MEGRGEKQSQEGQAEGGCSQGSLASSWVAQQSMPTLEPCYAPFSSHHHHVCRCLGSLTLS